MAPKRPKIQGFRTFFCFEVDFFASTIWSVESFAYLCLSIDRKPLILYAMAFEFETDNIYSEELSYISQLDASRNQIYEFRFKDGPVCITYEIQVNCDGTFNINDTSDGWACSPDNTFEQVQEWILSAGRWGANSFR